MKTARWMQRSLGVSTLAAVCALAASDATASNFTGLGHLGGTTLNSLAHAISADGSTVLGMSVSAGGQEAFRWTAATGMVGMGGPPGVGYNSAAFGASADGSVIVGFGQGFQAFRWTTTTGSTILGDLPGGQTFSAAYDVSANGAVAVGFGSADTGRRAFRWTQAAGMVDLGVLAGLTETEAYRTSSAGDIVVGRSTIYRSTLGRHEGEAFRWTQAGGMQGLGHVPGRAGISEARNISADGSVIVGYSAAEQFGMREAFRWTAAGGMTGIGMLPGNDSSEAWGISADGSIIVGQSSLVSNFAGRRAFIWDAANGMLDLHDVLSAAGLDVTGWQLTRGSAVTVHNSQLFLAGHGINPSGSPEAWMAVIPEPAGLALGAFSLLPLLSRRRRGSGRFAGE
jgi:probable HAF family extracellular repeat protein